MFQIAYRLLIAQPGPIVWREQSFLESANGTEKQVDRVTSDPLAVPNAFFDSIPKMETHEDA